MTPKDDGHPKESHPEHHNPHGEGEHQEKQHGREEHAHDHKHVAVTVKYVGYTDYHADFPPQATVGEIKLKAMKHFALELSAADKYVLQYNGADIGNNHLQVGSFGKKEVVFGLTLVQEVVKG